MAVSLGVVAVFNLLFLQPRLGVALYSYALGLLPLVAVGVEALVFALAFFLLARAPASIRAGSPGVVEERGPEAW